MGKASKKVKRQAQKNIAERNLQQYSSKEKELDVFFANEDYPKVLEVLAELIQVRDIKPDLLYKGAYSYFMLGDYERAAQWINNTLSYDKHHVEARILLARLCFMQERHEDGLAIYDFLVENYRQTMTESQKEQIMDSSECYVRREAEKLRQNYPYLADFLQVGKIPSTAPMNPVETESTTVPESGNSALSALQRLKAKLQAVQAQNGQDKADEPAVDKPTTDTKEEPVGNVESDRQIEEIMNRTGSLREKVQLLNKFAAAQYMESDYQAAAEYLKAALRLDDGDSQTIRNMAMTQAALGDMAKAQAVAACLPKADFMLLYMLKKQAHE